MGGTQGGRKIGSLSQAHRIMLVILAALVALFAATWLTIPAVGPAREANPPASWFTRGLDHTHPVLYDDDRDALRQRVLVFYGAAAAVVVLVGFALGGRRSSTLSG